MEERRGGEQGREHHALFGQRFMCLVCVRVLLFPPFFCFLLFFVLYLQLLKGLYTMFFFFCRFFFCLFSPCLFSDGEGFGGVKKITLLLYEVLPQCSPTYSAILNYSSITIFQVFPSPFFFPLSDGVDRAQNMYTFGHF